MINKNPYQTYKQQSVMTMTQGDMLTTIYNGLLKELNFAKNALPLKDYSEVNRSLQKAQLILRHLIKSLDFNYPISNNLNALYDYIIYVTIQVNVNKDLGELDGIIGMVTELRDTYIQADKNLRMGATGS